MVTNKALIVLLCIAPLMGGCGFHGRGTQGTVTDARTGAPIPGAIVAMLWKGTLPGFAHSQTVCIHVATTTTDEGGRYLVPGWFKVPSVWPVTGLHALIISHKPGYRLVSGSGGLQKLEPSTGTRENRLEYLSRMAVSCSHIKEIEIKLLPLYKALYEEARSIAVTKEEKLKALYRLRDVERLELGSDEAWKNFRQRKKELQ